MEIMAFTDATILHAALSPKKGDTEPASGLTSLHTWAWEVLSSVQPTGWPRTVIPQNDTGTL